MTIDTVITQTDSLHPNQYDREQKIKWISDLDGQVYNEILMTCGADSVESPAAGFAGYDGDTAGTTELLVPYPYSDVYIWYIIRNMDLYNNEIARYNNSNAMYNNAYLTYSDYYTRRHGHGQGITNFKV